MSDKYNLTELRFIVDKYMSWLHSDIVTDQVSLNELSLGSDMSIYDFEVDEIDREEDCIYRFYDTSNIVTTGKVNVCNSKGGVIALGDGDAITSGEHSSIIHGRGIAVVLGRNSKGDAMSFSGKGEVINQGMGVIYMPKEDNKAIIRTRSFHNTIYQGISDMTNNKEMIDITIH